MKIEFHWIGGASFILTIGNLKIAIDPVLCPKGTVQDYFWFTSKRLEKPHYRDEDFKNINLWLITHNHEDHLDTIGLSKIVNPVRVVSNKNSIKKIQNQGITTSKVLHWNEVVAYRINNYKIKIEALPAIHGINPFSAMLAGKVNGYYLTISKGQEISRIYITGDTVYKESIVKLLKSKPIDLLIPNMGAAKQGTWIMTLTLNAGMLKKLISKLNPKVVIPVHYGTFEHYKESVDKIIQINDDRIQVVAVGSKTQIEIGNTIEKIAK